VKDIKIELATIEDIHKVMKILNEVTEDLLDKDINQWEYPWKEEVIKEDIIKSRIFLVVYEGVIIGTFSIRALDDQDNAFYRGVEGKYLYRIAILPRTQGLGFGVTMLNLIRESETLNRNNLYLDCWDGNKKLRNFYLESGFIYMGDYPEDDYYISIYKLSK
jgi:GNAT superfamily N-acetyltransferase